MDGERSPEHRRGLPVLAERHVAQPLPREGPEVRGVARQRLAAVADRSLVVLREIAGGGPLVPPLGEFRRALDDAREDLLGLREVLALHRLDAADEKRVELLDPRATPHLPERRLRPRRGGGILALQDRQRLLFRHDASNPTTPPPSRLPCRRRSA